VTQGVKRPRAVETDSRVPYNQAVSKAILALICTPLLMGGACEKKSPKAGDTGALNAALDHGSSNGSGGAAIAEGPVDTTPLPGIDVSKLGDKTQTFYKLVGSLQSPCGKAESLRASFTKDTSCKRAPFAIRYVMALLDDEATEAQAREEYENKYKPADKVNLDVSKAPHEGATDAPIRFVEFFDYGCPHCAAFKPMMDQVLADEQGKVVTYFLMFPLEKHVDSKSAAQAAYAANAQGKFKEMHSLLFEKAPDQDHAHVTEYAKQLGLDMTKFEADYNAAAPQVAADLKQGENVGVDSTPTVFFMDRKYDGPMHPKYMEMWIEEELAVNR
jgi:protein-disulfide isomerase